SHGFRLVSGGTDNHLMLVDLRTFDEECTGAVAQDVLDRAGITLNKNTVPGEKRSPFVTSGVRIGTPAMTTRGMGTTESIQVADWIADLLLNPADPDLVEKIRSQVLELCQAFPIYPNFEA
ncbi:MAG: serine hydroxymethyltransferase, partial [Myxococcota bacterium]|nr:serine hydroxymethyltransferase [Myxococcota bacterium]